MFRAPLYHWSPAQRHKSIIKHGLVPQERSTVASGSLRYLCFGITPSGAWSLSGGALDDPEIEEWDLWQVWLAEHDNVHVRPFFGMDIEEVKVFNAIPPDRLWFIGRREA